MAPTRRSFLTMAALASTVPTLAACSGSRNTAGTAASGGAASQASDASAGDSDTDLVIWADQKKADSLKEIAKTWGKQQGISVAVQTVANDLQPNFITANQAGNGPDIVLGAHDWIGNLVQNSAIRPVVLSPEAESNYSDIALKAVTYDGQIYATPYAVECLGLFVNKALTSVTQPASIEEMIEAGKAAGTELVLSQVVDEKGDAYNMEPIYTAAGGYMFGKNPDGSYDPNDLGIGKRDPSRPRRRSASSASRESSGSRSRPPTTFPCSPMVRLPTSSRGHGPWRTSRKPVSTTSSRTFRDSKTSRTVRRAPSSESTASMSPPTGRTRPSPRPSWPMPPRI